MRATRQARDDLSGGSCEVMTTRELAHSLIANRGDHDRVGLYESFWVDTPPGSVHDLTPGAGWLIMGEMYYHVADLV